VETKNFTFVRNNIECKGIGDFFSTEDFKMIQKTYFSWKDLNKTYKLYNCRRANFPEMVSEGLPCLVFNWVRTNATHIKGITSSSCDAIDLKTGKLIQIKSCSSDKDTNIGPTSFGPRSQFDKLIFIHCDCDKDIVYFYDLSDIDYTQIMVNKTETLYDQQQAGKRPRFNVFSKIIQPFKLKPFYKTQFVKE